MGLRATRPRSAAFCPGGHVDAPQERPKTGPHPAATGNTCRLMLGENGSDWPRKLRDSARSTRRRREPSPCWSSCSQTSAPRRRSWQLKASRCARQPAPRSRTRRCARWKSPVARCCPCCGSSALSRPARRLGPQRNNLHRMASQHGPEFSDAIPAAGGALSARHRARDGDRHDPGGEDPTNRGSRAWSIMQRLTLVEGEFAGRTIGEHSPPWQEGLLDCYSGIQTSADFDLSARRLFQCQRRMARLCTEQLLH